MSNACTTYKAFTQKSFNEASSLGRFPSLDSDYKSVLKSRCFKPIKCESVNKFSGETEILEFPCGHCWHCQQTKQNEWVSRMQLHTLHSPSGNRYNYVYFVTLTYSPLYPNSPDPLFKFYKNMYCCWDDCNSRGKSAMHPCILDKEHCSWFMRRLRNVLEEADGIRHKDLSFFCCMEYGETHGRPHLHFILWDNLRIKPSHINRAWSIYYTNDKDNNPLFYPIGQIDFHDLYANGSICHIGKESATDPNIKAVNAFGYVAKYCTKREYNNIRVLKAFENYDYYFSQLSDYEPELARKEFLRCNAPCTRSSRGNVIGSFYLAANVERFAKGNTRLPQDDNGESLLYPNYFRRKTLEYINGLRCISFSESLNAMRLLPTAFAHIWAPKSDRVHWRLQRERINFDYRFLTQIDEQVRNAKKHSSYLVDLFDRSIYMPDSDDNIVVIRWNKHSRHYDYCGTVSPSDWYRIYYQKYKDEYAVYQADVQKKVESDMEKQKFIELCDSFGVDFVEFHADCLFALENEIKSERERYNALRTGKNID